MPTPPPMPSAPLVSRSTSSVGSKGQHESKQDSSIRAASSSHGRSSLPKTEPMSTSPPPPPKPTGPCPPGSLCAEAYERKLAEARREFEVKSRQLQEKLEADRRSDLTVAERRLAEETAKLQRQNMDEVAAVKKKQWCVNCSQEAFFPCCKLKVII